ISISRDGRWIVFQSEGSDETITAPKGGSSESGSTTFAYLPGTYIFDQATGTRMRVGSARFPALSEDGQVVAFQAAAGDQLANSARGVVNIDRKSTRLNSSHVSISYAVFCLKKKKNKEK